MSCAFGHDAARLLTRIGSIGRIEPWARDVYFALQFRHEIAAGFHAICQGLASCEINGVFETMRVTEPAKVWQTTLAAYITGLRRTPS